MRCVSLEVASFFQVLPEGAGKSLAVIRQEPKVILSCNICMPAASLWEPVPCTVNFLGGITAFFTWLAFYDIPDDGLQNEGVLGDKVMERRTKHSCSP